MRSLVGATLAGLILLGACGGDDDDKSDNSSSNDSSSETDGDAQPYVDALATKLLEGEEVDALSLDETSADCFATSVVDAFGVDNLEAADVTAEEFADATDLSTLGIDIPEDAVDDITAGLEDCGIATNLRDAFITQLTSDLPTEVPEAGIACMEDEIGPDDAAGAVAETFVTGNPNTITDTLFSAVGACPDVATAYIMSGATNVTPEVEDCVAGWVDDNGDAVTSAFEGSAAGLDDLLDDLTTACPDAAFDVGE